MHSLCKWRHIAQSTAAAVAGARRITTNSPRLIRQVDKDELPKRIKNLLPISMYGGEHVVTLRTGSDTMGKQGLRYMRQIIESTNVPITFECISPAHSPDEYLISVMRNRCALNIDTSVNYKDKSKNLNLNNDLDLFASVTKVFTIDGFNCRFPDVDIIMISQNNMGDYSKLEYEPVEGVVETLRVCTDESIRRFAHFAFSYAKKKNRKKLTFAHKRSSLPLADGLFVDIAKEVHECSYPDMELNLIGIDSIAAELAVNPNQFDVICSNEQCGTLLMSIASSVCGGACLFSMKEVGDHHTIFKPLQTRLSITNTMELSPYGIVMCCVDLMEHLGHYDCAKNLFLEMLCCMASGIKTRDFGGRDKGAFVICNIINNINCKFA